MRGYLGREDDFEHDIEIASGRFLIHVVILLEHRHAFTLEALDHLGSHDLVHREHDGLAAQEGHLDRLALNGFLQ